MKTVTMLKPGLEEYGYGSSFDPVLAGVAHGLARLFPPIDIPSERDEDAPAQDIRVCASEHAESHRRS